MKELLLALLMEASQLSGLSIPVDAKLPRVQFADRCELANLEAGEKVPCPRPDQPQAIAVFLDEIDTIVVSHKIRQQANNLNMTLVHELVHYLQDQHGLIEKARKRGCLQSVEKLAYKVQFAWLKKHNLPKSLADIDEITLHYATSCYRR